MKKVLLSLMLTLSFASATGLSTNGLTEKQKAEAALYVANMKEQSGVVSTSTADNFLSTLSQFESIGEQTGLAVKRSLEAVVDVADKFSNTPVGQITIALVVWRVAGDSIVALFLGIIIFTIGLILFRRLYFDRKIPVKTETVPRFWGLYTVEKPVEWTFRESNGEDQSFAVVILCISTAVFVGSMIAM
jgi:hypothetical protein